MHGVARLRGVFRRRLSYPQVALIIVAAFVVISCLAVPLKVTVDGIFYIASAKSLFTSDFAELYVWYREPGYPFFLAAIHTLGNAGLLVIAVQAACMGAAGFIAFYSVRRMLGQTDATVSQVLIALVLLLNPMYVIYSALVLQQALFSLQLALYALALAWAMAKPRWLPTPVLLIAVILHYFVCIWTSIGWIYLGLIPVAAVVTIALFPQLKRLAQRVSPQARRFSLGVASVVLSGLVLVGVYASGLQVYGGWVATKTPYTERLVSDEGTSVIEPLTEVPYIPTIGAMTQRMFALMHIGTVGDYEKENSLFLNQQLTRTAPYSQWDTAFVAEPHSSYALDYIAPSDASPVFHTMYSIAAKVASPVYSATFIGFLLAVIVAALRRKWKLLVILAVPLNFLGVYAASNSPIDRYGIPAYPIAAVAVGVLLTWAVDWVAQRRKSRSLRSEAIVE